MVIPGVLGVSDGEHQRESVANGNGGFHGVLRLCLAQRVSAAFLACSLVLALALPVPAFPPLELNCLWVIVFVLRGTSTGDERPVSTNVLVRHIGGVNPGGKVAGDRVPMNISVAARIMGEA